MHSTTIHHAEGILGSFEHDKMLKVGDAQSMVFEADRNRMVKASLKVALAMLIHRNGDSSHR
jgi:hypothetical protein